MRLGLPFAEYSFANLYLFRAVHDYRFVDGAVPFVSGITYDGMRHGLPLAPLDGAGAKALLAETDCLYPVTHATATSLGPAFAARTNNDDSDYLYAAASLAALEGIVLKPKRQQAAVYARSYLAGLRLAPGGFVPAARNLLDHWQADVGKSSEDTDYRECSEAIALADELGLETALLTGNGEAHGFLLASRLADGSKAVHFAKARRDIVGSYPMLFSLYAAQCGVETLNFEQDMGKAGFRQAKRALGPRAQLEKLRLTALPSAVAGR